MVETFKVKLGNLPIMVGSKFCNLDGLNEEQLVGKGEDLTEFGGYFLINGNERLVRMVIQQKRNFPIAFSRPTFINRGKGFTSYACMMRCVRDDLFAQTITLHYVSDGSCTLRLLYLKQEFLLPVIAILKALFQCPDSMIYHRILNGAHKDRSIVGDRVESILQQGKNLNLYSQEQCQAFLGSRFRTILTGVTDEMTDSEAGVLFLMNHICVHLPDF